jgi:hypothetical protein
VESGRPRAVPPPLEPPGQQLASGPGDGSLARIGGATAPTRSRQESILTGRGLHCIEGSLKVYLLFDEDTGQWAVDPVSVDGYALDESLLEASSECGCGDEQACELVRQRADKTSTPSGAELRDLLSAALSGPRDPRGPRGVV